SPDAGPYPQARGAHRRARRHRQGHRVRRRAARGRGRRPGDRRGRDAGRGRDPRVDRGTAGPRERVPSAHGRKGGHPMTTTTARPVIPHVGIPGLRLVRSEFRKIRTTNAWWLFGIASLVITGLTLWINLAQAASDIARARTETA